MFDGLLLPSLRSTRPARVELDPLDGINRGLTGFWPMGDGGSRAADLSGYRRHLTRYGGAACSAAPWGVATKVLRASSQYARGPTIAATTKLSVAFWVKGDAAPGTSVYSQPFTTDEGAGGRLIFSWDHLNPAYVGSIGSAGGGYPKAQFTTAFAANKPYLIVATHDGALVSIYCNGLLEGSFADSMQSASGAVMFGANTNNGAYFSGYVGLGRTWSRVLAASDVQRLYRDPWAGTIDPAGRLFFAFKAPAAGGVTVSLTGIGSTFSAGTLIANRSIPLTGSAIPSAAGTLVPTRSLPLTGSAAMASAGTVTASRTLPLTGSAATASAGVLTANRSLPITGAASTLSAGTVKPGMTFALSGQALSSAAGTVASSRVLSITGQAITSGIGTVSVGSNVSVALTGLAITAASGAVGIGLAVAIAGSAMTLSAGSVGYSARFTLVGIGTASASGSVGVSGGGATVDAALVGLSIAVSPGNVKVTGGTRWVPQAARAVAVATTAGNTLPPPPRLTGDTKADIQAQGQWLATLYDQLVKVNNVFGRINDHETRIAALEASNDNTH